jgi:enamine deaminase RidA (YjgF/YER057c/UK114 family)
MTNSRNFYSTLKRLLAAGDTNVGFTHIWLTDLAAFSDMNEVWEAWIVPGAPPARAAVASPELESQDFKLEVSVIAAQS